jgi:hypothetical protein
MEGQGPALLMTVPPLALVGGAFLLGLGVVHRERHAEAAGWAGARRWQIIALLFVASLAHVPVIPEHLREAPYMGVLFVLFALTAFGLAAVLAIHPSILLYRIAGGLCAAAIVAYAATRVVAFPQLADDVGNWTEPLGMVSVLAELGVVVISTAATRRTAAPMRHGHA